MPIKWEAFLPPNGFLDFQCRALALLLVLVIFPQAFPCEPSNHVETAQSGTLYDEPILLEESASVSPIHTASDESFFQFTFDFSETPLVLSGSYDDLVVRYVTSHTGDSDVWVLNTQTNAWDQVGFGSAGFLVERSHGHSVLMTGLTPQSYLDDDYLLNVRMKWNLSPSASASRINPKYRFIPLSVPDEYGRPIGFRGLTFDGDSLLASTDEGVVYTISPSTGSATITSVTNARGALAYDGERLWTVSSHRSGTRAFRAFNSEGIVLCEFPFLHITHRTGGLAFAQGSLWMSEYWEGGEVGSVYQIDPIASCVNHDPVVTGETGLSPEDSRGMTWDGERLLISVRDKIYTMTPNGEVLDSSFTLPINEPVKDLAWDGEGVWVIHRGLKELRNEDQVLSRFILPPGQLKADIDRSRRVDSKDLYLLLDEWHEQSE